MTHALTAEQERAHVATMRAHPEGSRPWMRARDALVLSALSVAERVARRYSGRTGLDYGDLLGEAHIGLIDAATRLDPDRGTMQAAALQWARKRVLEAIERDRAVRVSARAVRELGHIARAESRLWVGATDAPTEQDVAREARLTVARVRELREVSHALSLDARRDADDRTLGDMQAAPEYVSDVGAREALLRRLLAGLDRRHRVALRLTMGLGTVRGEAADGRALAAMSERSAARVRALARDAVDALRARVAAIGPDERADAVEACGW